MKLISIENKNKLTTQKIFFEVFILGFVLVLGQCIYHLIFALNNQTNNYYFVVNTILVTLVSISSCVTIDVLYRLPVLFNKHLNSNFKKRLFIYIKEIGDSTSYITGLIIALFLPASFKLYFIPILALISFLFGKFFYNAKSSNIFNPALISILFGTLLFHDSFIPVDITTGLYSTKYNQIDLYILFRPINGFSLNSNNIPYTLFRVFIGDYLGTIGSTNSLFLSFIGLYLLFRKIIDFRITLFYIIGLFVSYFIAFITYCSFFDSIINATSLIFAGPYLLIGIFCLNDPVTSPTNRLCKVAYSLLACNITVFIVLNSVSFSLATLSVLIPNILTFLTNAFYIGKKKQRITLHIVISLLLVGLLIIPLTLKNALSLI